MRDGDDSPERESVAARAPTAARYAAISVLACPGVSACSAPSSTAKPSATSTTVTVRVGFFHAARAALHGTTLLATIPRRLAELQAAADPRLRLVEAPEDFDAFPYGMIWHARLDSDPAHMWLRAMMREAAQDLTTRA